MIADHSQRLTTGRWEQAVNSALERVNRLSREDKLAIALHDFAAVTAEDFVPFDYCDGPNGVRGHQGAMAFPSALALAASFDLELARRYAGQGSFTRRSPAIDIRVSSRTLHEIYLEPFRRALIRYGVAGLLGSYNRLNGRYTCQDPELLDSRIRLVGNGDDRVAGGAPRHTSPHSDIRRPGHCVRGR